MMRIFFSICCLFSGFLGEATIVINVSNCNIESSCIEESRCGNVCQFSGLNTIGDIITLKVATTGADVLEKGIIKDSTPLAVQFQKRDWQSLITYVPTSGHMSNRKVSLLFYNVDIENKSHLATLPRKMRNSIEKYRVQNQNIRYALFIFKAVRTDIWQEISETYLAKDSPDNVLIPITVYPDGNIQITAPGGVMYINIRIDQMS